MTLILSEQQLPLPINSVNLNTHEQIFTCPQSQSRGCKRLISLRYGIQLIVWDFQLQESLVESALPIDAATVLEFGFNLAGKYRWGLSHWQSFVEFGSTEPGRELLREWLPEQRVLKVDLCLLTPNNCKTFSPEQLELIPPELRQIIESADADCYCQNLGAIAPAVQLVLRQIINCPYQGWTQQIYLEGKALELIALQSAQFLQLDKKPSYQLKPIDIERIYQARDILTHNLEQPPSLLELARQVGLNDCTLKRGFRQIFGTTAFGYLRQQRLEQARQLLTTREMNITEVAGAVGYSHPGYFAAAFKREFGVHPKSFQQSSG